MHFSNGCNLHFALIHACCYLLISFRHICCNMQFASLAAGFVVIAGGFGTIFVVQ